MNMSCICITYIINTALLRMCSSKASVVPFLFGTFIADLLMANPGHRKKQVVAGSYISIYIYIHTYPYRSLFTARSGTQIQTTKPPCGIIWWGRGAWDFQWTVNGERSKSDKVAMQGLTTSFPWTKKNTWRFPTKKSTPKQKDDCTGKSHLRIYKWMTTGGTPMTCRKPPHLLFEHHIPLTHSARSRGYWFLSDVSCDHFKVAVWN